MSSNTQITPYTRFSKPSWAIFTAMLGALLIGASPIFVRLTDHGPISTGFFRLFLSLPFFWIWVRWDNKKHRDTIHPPTRRDCVLMLLGGLFFGMDIALWNAAIGYTTIANSCLLNNLSAFLIPFIVWALTSEKPRPIFMTGAAVALIGLALLTGCGLHIQFSHGDALALCSAFTVAGYLIILRELRQRIRAATIMYWTGISSTICLGIIVFATGETLLPSTFKDCFILALLAILVHVGGQGLVATSMDRLTAAVAAVTLLLAPTISAIIAWWLFAESLDPQKILGGALVLSSIVIIHLKQRHS